MRRRRRLVGVHLERGLDLVDVRLDVRRRCAHLDDALHHLGRDSLERDLRQRPCRRLLVVAAEIGLHLDDRLFDERLGVDGRRPHVELGHRLGDVLGDLGLDGALLDGVGERADVDGAQEEPRRADPRGGVLVGQLAVAIAEEEDRQLGQLGARQPQQLERLDAEDAERDDEHERILVAHGVERALAAFGHDHAQPRLRRARDGTARPHRGWRR